MSEERKLISASVLAKEADVSLRTVLRLMSARTIVPARHDDRGYAQFDLSDPKVAAWLAAVRLKKS
jgi:hypothetical protein